MNTMKHILNTFWRINIKQIFILCVICTIAYSAKAETITIEPLFEYPIAPEELETLTAKSNWLMQHFWDNMDFKKKGAVDQIALNDAMKIYALPMQWAEKSEVDKSVNNLISKIAKNPTLQVQFTKAAEENLYGQRAQIWIDEIYIKFIEGLLKNKKLSDARKVRYRRQLNILNNTLVGNTAPSFDFVTPTGNPGRYQPIGVFTIIEFGDPDCDDCRHAKLKMETNVRFSSLVDRGLVNILFIIPDPNDGWQTKLAGYPSKWVIGASDTVADVVDIRTTPSFLIVGKDGKIIAKNASVEQAMNLALKENE